MMAGIIGRKCYKSFLNARTCRNPQIANMSYKKAGDSFRRLSKTSKIALAVAASAGVGALGVTSALQYSVSAIGLDLAPPHFPWSHSGWFQAFDHSSIRRGYQVYKQVCAACHSLDFVRYRDFIGVFMTEEEAKEEAKEAMVTDGPGSDGLMFQRPGKLSDAIPPPYPNDQAAMAANNGALPPDLSLLALAREHEENYVFALLTGYCDPPPGMAPQEDLHYNPYFSGSWINMAQALYNEIIEYEDGTPATQSQLAKDVTTFLRWTAEPEHDLRKRIFLKFIPIVLLGFFSAVYFRRHKTIAIRSRIVSTMPPKK